MAIAMEKLFGPLPPPAAVAGCSGCQSVAKFMTPTFNGTAQPNATQLWSTFGFTFNGTCNSNALTNYGKNGESGLPRLEAPPALADLLLWLFALVATARCCQLKCNLFLPACLQLLHALLHSNSPNFYLQAFWVWGPTTSWHPSAQQGNQ